MDEARIETMEPIFELASECESLFSEKISKLKSRTDLNGAKVVGEYEQRFAAWAAFLGVFAVPEMCLDRRLRRHVEIQDLVLRLLDIIKRNLAHLLETDDTSTLDGEDIEIPDSDRASPPHLGISVESLRGIGGAVDRLSHLGETIQRSSEAGQATKFGKFATSFDSSSFEEIARLAINSFYPDASPSLLEQLIRTMTDMYERFHYRRSRQVRLQARSQALLSTIDEEPASNATRNTLRVPPPPTTPPVMNLGKQLPRIISTIHSEYRSHKSKDSKPTSLDSQEFGKLFSQQKVNSVKSKTRSILFSQAAYPRPSQESLFCEWCFLPLPEDEFKGEKWRAQDLSEHISKIHDDIFTRPQIQIIVHQSQLRSPRPQDVCPLCCLSMRDGQDNDEEKQVLEMTLLPKDQELRESHKRVKTEAGPIQQTQQTEVNSGAEMEQTALTTGILSSQSQQPLNIEAIASHVAAHLQGIMLFALRMMSLEVAPDMSADDKTLSSGTDHDSSWVGSNQQRSEHETDADSDLSEQQDDNMDLDDPSLEDDIPDCEHAMDWQDVVHNNERLSGTDTFLQEIIRSEPPEMPTTTRVSIQPPRNPYFVDREDIISRIIKQCSEPASRVALVGLGGIGKSQLAIELAYRTAAEAPDVWVFWIYADTQEHIEEGFRRIADTVGFPGQDLYLDDLFQVVFDWLSDVRKGRWILIFDGVNEQQVLHEGREPKLLPLVHRYLPPQRRNSSIIITTRNKDLGYRLTGDHRNVIEIGPMPVVEATSLFRKRVGSIFQSASDMNAAVSLVKALGLIPLAINQAAVYIEHQSLRIPLNRFLDKLQESEEEKMEFLEFDAGLHQNGDVSNNILTTWQASFDSIRSQRPSAADLLSRMSFFDRRGIPKWLLTQDDSTPRANSPTIMGRLELDSSDGDTNSDSDDTFNGDIEMLMNHYLIAANRTRDIFEMHGLVQLSVKKTLTASRLQAINYQFIKRLAVEFPARAYSNWYICQELFAHVQEAAKYYPSDEALWNWATLLHYGGRYGRLQGEYEIAKQMADKALRAREQIRRNLSGADKNISLENSSLIALILMDQGFYNEADELFTRIANTYKRRGLGADHSNTITIMNNQASIYRILGRWEEAEKIQVEVVRTRNTKLEEDHPSTLTSIANLASIYRAQGRYTKAEELQLRVMEGRKKQLGQGHPLTLTSMSNLASIYRIQGKLEEAGKLQTLAMNVREIKFGKDHPDTLASMNGLASIFRDQGRLGDAEDLQVQVTKLRTTMLGTDHPNTLASMNNLALIYNGQGECEKAITLQEQVVQICKIKLGHSHPHTLTGLNNLALISKSQGQHEEFMRLMKDCSEARERVLGPEHPYTISSKAAVNRWSE
ncbi:hypothetical protein ACHAQJ_000487 [Trichoderma viride]